VSTPPRQLRSSAVALLAAVALASAAPGSARATRYLAPVGHCDGNRLEVMLCLHDYARHQAGLPSLRVSAPLMRAAGAKSVDIARCGFSHTACGHALSHRADGAGYRWTRFGENIAYGTGSPLPSARVIFAAWLRSGEHRANILDPAFQDVGVGSRRVTGEGASTRFWVAEFGHH
jgi:uncharacterized protein YkwD